MQEDARTGRAARHPLEPLDAAEMRQAAAILRAGGRLREGMKVIGFTLREPTREDLRASAGGRALEREVFAILLDSASGETEEAIVSLAQGRVRSSRRLSGVQPAIVHGELRPAEQAVREDPAWQAAMLRRGVTDFGLCMIDLWPAGNFGTAAPGQRLSRALTWVRAHSGDNGYAHPVEGVVTIVDLNALKVVVVEDHRLVPLPKEDGNYTPDAVGARRADVKPLEIHQPAGPGIDGPRNSVYEVDTVADPPGPENPHGNAFRTRALLLAREAEAQRLVEARAARFWRIVNPSSKNRLGGPVGYRLMPGENVPPFAAPNASVSRRAWFITKQLWVTRYDPAERYAAGDYPNQHAGGAGLPAYVAADRRLEDTELVVWYTFGAHHVVRPEDWPVMPVVSLGFMLKPDGFFDRSPALDVPPSAPHHAPGGGPHCH